MRVFAFVLMLAVGIGGSLFGYRLITGKNLVSPSDLGLMQGGKPPVVTVTPAPTATTSGRPTAVPTETLLPSPSPTPTPVPDKPQTMVVGNTDGEGVFLRRTPHLDDRVRAWMDGARMEIIGQPVDSDGVHWAHVRAPDGTEGYIPQQYLK